MATTYGVKYVLICDLVEGDRALFGTFPACGETVDRNAEDSVTADRGDGEYTSFHGRCKEAQS